MGSIKQILIIGGVGAVIAGAVWYGMTSATPSALTTTTDVSGASNAAERDLLDTLLALRAVKLESMILSDPAFLSLQDYGTQIVSEPVGRRNPFAPLDEKSTDTPR